MFERRIAPRAPAVKTDDELLAEVLATPDDDAPRLVYADRLQQAGDPRGELITIQCALARGAHGDELRRREQELLERHKKTWVGDFAGTRIEYGTEGGKTYVKGTPTKWHFARGFVDRVEMQVPDFIRNAPGLFSREPVRVVHLTSGSLTAFLKECTEQHRIRELDLDRWTFRGTELRDLATSDKLTSLEVLRMRNCKIGVKAMIAFAEHAVEMPSLRELHLGWNAFGDKGAVALAGSRILRSVKRLNLAVNKVTDEAIARFDRRIEVKR